MLSLADGAFRGILIDMDTRERKQGRGFVAIVFLLLVVNLVFATAANILIKLSSDAATAALFIVFQIAGNVAGLLGVLAYTGVLKRLPLHIGYPLTQGIAAIGVLGFGSVLVFKESFGTREAIGCALVVAGVALVGIGARKRGKLEAPRVPFADRGLDRPPEGSC